MKQKMIKINGVQIRSMMKIRHMTIKSLAAKIGIAPRTLSKYLSQGEVPESFYTEIAFPLSPFDRKEPSDDFSIGYKMGARKGYSDCRQDIRKELREILGEKDSIPIKKMIDQLCERSNISYDMELNVATVDMNLLTQVIEKLRRIDYYVEELKSGAV